MTTMLCVPQWQGSASRNASRLVAGARRTAGLVEAEDLVTVPVLEAGGGKQAGIRALDVLLENLRLTRQALAGGRRRRQPRRGRGYPPAGSHVSPLTVSAGARRGSNLRP